MKVGLWITILFLASCNSGDEEDEEKDNTLPAYTETEERKILTPGENYVIEGSVYTADTRVFLAGVEVETYLTSSGQIGIRVPENLENQAIQMTVEQAGQTYEVTNVVSLSDSGIPVFTASASSICSDQQFYNQDWQLVQGTANCVASTVVNCSADGETGCITSSSYPAAQADGLAGKVVSGNSVAGIAGTAGASDCTATVQAGCEADSACRWTGAACEINPWNIKAGVTIAGTTGSVKTNCRNPANASIFNYDGDPSGIGTGANTDMGALDWWDTIDNNNNNTSAVPTEQPSGWTSDNLCGKEIWDDVTPDGSCDSATDDCMMRDNVSGLTWSESYPATEAAPVDTGAAWNNAVNRCDKLSFGGKTDWRLPTQMELMQAVSHGIRQLGFKGGALVDSKDNNVNFIANVDQSFWSASSSSIGTSFALRVSLRQGTVSNSTAKTTNSRVICVSP